MAYNTAILQGSFTADGNVKTLDLRSDWDWIHVINQTVAYAGGANSGYDFYFQRGMTNGRGMVTIKTSAGASQVGQIAANAGFFFVDSARYSTGVRTALTGLTAANPPVVTSAGQTLSVGDVIRFDSLNNQPQISGIDFTVTASATTFTIGNINLTNSTASTAGFWRKINYDPMYYPRRRTVTYVSSETECKVYMSVTHGYTVGQKIRLQFPGGAQVWGDYAILDGQEATILAINAARAGNEPDNGGVDNNIVLNIDTSTFTAWNASFGASLNQAYPASSEVPFTPAQVVPFGEDTAYALSQDANILDDATRNTSILGVQLAAGVTSPAGSDGDVIYWVAGKSFSNTVG